MIIDRKQQRAAQQRERRAKQRADHRESSIRIGEHHISGWRQIVEFAETEEFDRWFRSIRGYGLSKILYKKPIESCREIVDAMGREDCTPDRNEGFINCLRRYVSESTTVDSGRC